MISSPSLLFKALRQPMYVAPMELKSDYLLLEDHCVVARALVLEALDRGCGENASVVLLRFSRPIERAPSIASWVQGGGRFVLLPFLSSSFKPLLVFKGISHGPCRGHSGTIIKPWTPFRV